MSEVTDLAVIEIKPDMAPALYVPKPTLSTAKLSVPKSSPPFWRIPP